MTLKNLLDEVFTAYDPDFVGVLYDEQGGEIGNGEKFGDTLALYVLRQTADCLNYSASRNEIAVADLIELSTAFDLAINQLHSVNEAIARLIENSNKSSKEGLSNETTY